MRAIRFASVLLGLAILGFPLPAAFTANSPVARVRQAASVETTGVKPVILDGSASLSVNGEPLSYEWSLVSAPSGSTAALIDAHSPLASFVPDLAGPYVAELLVRSAVSGQSASSRITISGADAPAPEANAGRDQLAVKGVPVSLDGSRSTDPSGGPLTYRWSLVSVPNGSEAKLSGADQVGASLIPDRPGKYVAQLVVCHGSRCSAPAMTVASTEAVAPVADAGRQQAVEPGTLVVLDGSRSADLAGQSLSYEWSFNAKPAGRHRLYNGRGKPLPRHCLPKMAQS